MQIKKVANKNASRLEFQKFKSFIYCKFNVSLDENFHVTDTIIIEVAKPTIDKIIADGGSVVFAEVKF